ncbi:hypothetical protein AAULH_05436 [Lactobacillus helveticus MTCC 5463]|nr:hypothetical protein AAULH_05436 [Lactobacillus helveticus MTCC 5463]
MVKKEHHEADEKNKYPYTFLLIREKLNPLNKEARYYDG